MEFASHTNFLLVHSELSSGGGRSLAYLVRRKMDKLCRFCECPVAEGGVLLSEVDADSLSSWWSKCLHTELDAETLRDAWSCRKCVADARFWLENCDGELEADLVWWPLDDSFYNFYKEHELKTLSVALEKLDESDFEVLEVKVEKISCKFCEATFFIPANLDLHVKRKHQSASGDQPFQCLFCNKLLLSRRNFKSHLKRLHGGKGVRCKFISCSAVFKTERDLDEHLQKVHLVEGKKAVECKVCKFWFYKNSLGTHMKTHGEKVKSARIGIKCKFCGDSFENKFNLYNHTKKIHKSEAIKCQISHCRIYFKTKEQMKEHFENTHRNNCNFCQLSFHNQFLLLSHLRKTHLEKKCKFSKCVFYTDSKEDLAKHLKQKHDKDDFLLTECVFCGKNFVDPENMTRHVYTFHSETAIKCAKPRCFYFAKSAEDLEQHKKEKHPKVERHKKTIVCLYCRKTIWDKATYASHIKQLHSREAIRCANRVCFTFFKSESERQKHHEEKHVGKYNCALCDYKGFKKDYVRKHFKQHHLPKDKKCPRCPKMFSCGYVLKAHVNYQHKAKNCPHCKNAGSNLTRHVVTANCPVCTQPFPCKTLLTQHKLKCIKSARVYLECG